MPLLWLPAFYYPKDELIINPSFGYRNREGYYINTTFYLYGRKPANAKSNADIRIATTSSDSETTSEDEKINFFSLVKSNKLKKQVREGLVLHNLDEDYTGDTDRYFKVMADYYANMGAMVGFDSNLAFGEMFKSVKANLELGFSNTIFMNDRTGTYIATNSNGERVPDSANLMGFKTPFRYQANLSMELTKPFTINISLPIYSDPYFGYDFNTRAETMDWIDYAMNGTSSDNDDSDITTTSTFTWSANMNHNFKIADEFGSHLSTLAISNFNSSVVFSSKANSKLSERSEAKEDFKWISYTPERQFFYPSQVTPAEFSFKIGGNIVKYPQDKKTSQKNYPNINLTEPDEFKESEKDAEPGDEGGESLAPDENSSDSKTEAGRTTFAEEGLPSLVGVTPTIRTLNPFTYSLDYTVIPAFSSQVSYNSTNIYTPEDFDWYDTQSTYIQAKSPISLTSTMSFKDGFVTLTDTLDFGLLYQSHPYLKDDVANGGYSEASRLSIENADNTARKLNVLDINALTIKPFYYTEHFSDTAITWNTSLKLLETKYVSTDPNEPEWEYLTMDVTDDELFTVHNVNFVLAAKEGIFSQKISMTATLPPQPDAYKYVCTFDSSFASLSLGSGIKRKSKTDDTWIKENFSQSFTLKLFESKLNLTQNYVYNCEEEYNDSLKFSVSGYGAQVAYTASYVSGYEFVQGSGWKAKKSTDKVFQPYSLSCAYISPKKAFRTMSEKVEFVPTLSSSFVYDYLKPTSSYFTFIPAFTFKINKFLDVTFSTECRNSSVFRYFCSSEDYEYYYRQNGERNMMTDLMNSFAFNDERKRRASAFKLKSFKVAVKHDLDDWDLNFEFSITPRYISATSSENKNNGHPYYDFEPYMKLSVSWRPLSSMKTQIVDKYGTWQLNKD